MESLSLEQLLEIENKTTVLSYTDFLENFKSRLNTFQLLHLLTDKKNLRNFDKLYSEYRVNGLICQTVDELYFSLLNDLIAVIDSTAIEKEPLSLSILIGDYLIPLGLLSYSTKFHYTNSLKLFSIDDNYYFNYSAFGKFVFCGYGCCRHITSLVSDIFSRMGIINDQIPCYSLEVENLVPSLMKGESVNHLILGF